VSVSLCYSCDDGLIATESYQT